MLPKFLQGLDDAYFYLLSPHGARRVLLVAMDFAAPSTSYRCRIIELEAPDVRGVEKAAADLRLAIPFDEIEYHSREVILSKNTDDPETALRISFNLGPHGRGRYSDCYLPGLDDLGSLRRAVQQLSAGGQLKWRSI
jgi:hypothetical protein